MGNSRLYLDANATTPLHPEIQKKWRKYWDVFGNPSSLHAEGREARNALDAAKERIGRVLGIPHRSLIVVGSGSEANSQVIASVPEGGHIIISAVEHACIRNATAAAQRRGHPVTTVPVDEWGRVSVDVVAGAIQPDTQLISIMTANNETGAIQPIAELADLARSRGILFHTDAVQALGKTPFLGLESGPDLITISAHKIYGPKGIAVLVIRDTDRLKPMIWGGPQEHALRAGTEAVPLAMAFADAVELVESERGDVMSRLAQLKGAFLDWFQTVSDVAINSPEDGLPNTINVSVQGISGEAIVRALDLNGIAISTGSACSTGSVEPSAVIRALGKPEWVTTGAFRVSMMRTTTSDDMHRFQTELNAIIRRLRG
ncbi:cysteine desulfurase [bacterium]|nr:cysteine desulfurase [bacterium]